MTRLNHKLSEQEMASRVVEWLEMQHWDVYQEVQINPYGSIADIVAVRDKKVWIIECKSSLTFAVLNQAYRWPAHFRSIAVPLTKRHNGKELACKIAKDYLSLGIIEVDHEVYENTPAPLMREYHNYANKIISKLCDGHKNHAKAGSRDGGYYTPYRRTMDAVKDFVRRNPGCTLKEIMNHMEDNHHYASNAGARSSIRIALENWETNWCEIKRDGRNIAYFLKAR